MVRTDPLRRNRLALLQHTVSNPTTHLSPLLNFTTSPLRVNTYSIRELSEIRTSMRLCFAHAGPNGSILNTPCHPLCTYKTNEDSLLSPPVRTYLDHISTLRCEAAFSSFNIYPTTATSLLVNDQLWRTAHTGYYDGPTADPILGAHILVLGLAPELHEFLCKVTLREMHRAIIDFLVLLHHQLTCDGDVAGLDKLQRDLFCDVWEELCRNIGQHHNGEPSEPHRARILEHLVQISFMTPWRVDVFAAFLTAEDVTGLMDCVGPLSSDMYALPEDDRIGDGKLRGQVMLKLYQDWRVYDMVLAKRLKMGYHAISEALERAIHTGKSAGIFEQAFVAIDSCNDPSSLFSKLPTDVVDKFIVPWIVRGGCESIAPRRRRLASLKSLLELSTKFFDELQEQNEGPVGENDETVQGGVLVSDLNGDRPLEEMGNVFNGTALSIGDRSVMEDCVDSDEVGNETAGLPLLLSNSRYSVESDETYPLDRFPWESEYATDVGELDLSHVADNSVRPLGPGPVSPVTPY